jgi:hypothetical protein
MALSFAGNGTIAGLSVGGLPDGTVDGDTLASGTGGKVLQVISTYSGSASTQSITSATNTAITGLSVSITPSSTSSKILVSARWCGETANYQDGIFGLQRGSTRIGDATSGGSRFLGIMVGLVSFSANNSSTLDTAIFDFIDAPASVSSLSYSMMIRTGATQTLYNNRTVTDADNSTTPRATSSITVMELSSATVTTT